jgi:hypothetical protein
MKMKTFAFLLLALALTMAIAAGSLFYHHREDALAASPQRARTVFLASSTPPRKRNDFYQMVLHRPVELTPVVGKFTVEVAANPFAGNNVSLPSTHRRPWPRI